MLERSRLTGKRIVIVLGMDPRVLWAIDEMQRQMSGTLTIADLAAATNLSASRLTHLFRTATGRSPARYLRELRMERARILLESTFLSVKEVRVSVGINDASHFTRDFRRHYGVPPRVWRTRVRSASPGVSDNNAMSS